MELFSGNTFCSKKMNQFHFASLLVRGMLQLKMTMCAEHMLSVRIFQHMAHSGPTNPLSDRCRVRARQKGFLFMNLKSIVFI